MLRDPFHIIRPFSFFRLDNMADAISILNRLIRKGGVLGSIAKIYVSDPEKGVNFIKELQVQLKTNKTNMQKNLGEEFINDLEKFETG